MVSSALYCGVSPHLEATLTIRSTLPLYALRDVSLPSISFSAIESREAAKDEAVCITARTMVRVSDFIAGDFMWAMMGRRAGVVKVVRVSRDTRAASHFMNRCRSADFPVRSNIRSANG